MYRFFLVMLIGFISLSCPAKREIKMALNIPTENSNTKDDQSKLKTCSEFQANRRTVTLDQVQAPSLDGGFALVPTNLYLSLSSTNVPMSSLLSSSQDFIPSLPIFILHQKYRL